MDKYLQIRILKITFAAVMSLAASMALGLQFASTAAIVAIVSVYNTRKDTLLSALKRIGSALAGLALAGILFKIFGFKIWVFGIYLLIFLSFSYLTKTDTSITPTTVLVTHLFSVGRLTFSIVANEFALLLVGIGFAILTNIYAPSMVDKVKKQLRAIDNKMEELLQLVSVSLTSDFDLGKKEKLIEELRDQMQSVEVLAAMAVGNNQTGAKLLFDDVGIRQRQADLLYEMFRDALAIPKEYADGNEMAEVMKRTSETLSKGSAIRELEEQLTLLKGYMETMPMPETVEELKIRSQIYQLFRSFADFLDCHKQICYFPGAEE